MRDHLSSGDICGVLVDINTADRRTCPRDTHGNDCSRLSVKGWDHDALFLLSQLGPYVLSAIVDGTIVQRHIHDRTFRELIKKPDRRPSKDKFEPFVYINCIADKDGLGLSPNDYELYLDALQFAADFEPSDGQITKTNNAKFNHPVNRRPMEQSIERLYQNDRQGGTVSFTNTTGTKFKEQVLNYVAANRARLDLAISEGVTNITPSFETGWSIYGSLRCTHHFKRDKSSPDHFRLAQLILLHLFPNRGFQLHQYILFHVFEVNQAPIGESIGTLLCGGYAKDGGFNSVAAGVQVTDVVKPVTTQWLQHRTSEVCKECIATIQRNADSWTDGYKKLAAEMNDLLRRHEEMAKLEQLREKVKHKRDEQSALLKEHEEVVLPRMSKVFDELKRHNEWAVKERERVERAETATRKLNAALGLPEDSSPDALGQKLRAQVAAMRLAGMMDDLTT